MRIGRRVQRGFTLLEVLVALALFSLILASFGTVFYRLEKTDAVIARMEGAENVEIVRRFLRQSLEASRAYPATDAEGQSLGLRKIRFVGEPSRVVFTTTASGREIGGIYQTEVSLDSSGKLLLQRRFLSGGGSPASGPDILLENLSSILFTYLPCPSRQRGPDRHRWTVPDRLPFMITLSASFNQGDSRTWRDVVAFVPAAACEGSL